MKPSHTLITIVALIGSIHVAVADEASDAVQTAFEVVEGEFRSEQ